MLIVKYAEYSGLSGYLRDMGKILQTVISAVHSLINTTEQLHT